MYLSIFCLGFTVTSQPSSSAAERSLNSIANALTKIVQLALGFLSLALEVLFSSLLLEVLVSKEVADGFFGTANGLIPLALGSVRVVFGRGAR